MKLPFIPPDKANHFIYGLGVGFVVLVAVRVLKMHEFYPLFLPMLAALVAGIVKEVALDYVANYKAAEAGEAPPHEVSWQDVVATALGGVPIGLAAHI